MGDTEIIDLTPDTIAVYGVCGYKDIKKHAELRRKIQWFSKYYSKGLRIKVLYSKKSGYQGMIEYIPGRYAHRPVDAGDYLFIHCIFVGFAGEFKGKGHGSALIGQCMDEARTTGMRGVAVVVRKGPFMAKREIFIKNGFVPVDRAAPDFELLACKFDPAAANPRFRTAALQNREPYADGLFILRSPQCPYSEKNVMGIMETAREKYGLVPRLVELDTAEAAQDAPCPFGTFCILYKGDVISHHPISTTRFVNIMEKLRK